MQLDIDGTIQGSTQLAALWQRLLAGQLFVSDTFYQAGRCFGVIERSVGRPAVRPIGVAIIERVFEGESQKALAFELGVSIATVACHSATVLRAIAHQNPVSRAPIILVMAALAARGMSLGQARLEQVHDDGRWVISVPVPGETLRSRLTSAEWDVARLSIEGQTHASIARVRASSPRTIANQLASAFRKLETSGRATLRAKAIQEHAEELARASTPAVALSTLVPSSLTVTPASPWLEPRLLAYG